MRIFLPIFLFCFIHFTYGNNDNARNIAKNLLDQFKVAVTTKNTNEVTNLFAAHFKYAMPNEYNKRIDLPRDLYVGFWMFYHKTPIFVLESATWDGPILRIKWNYEEETGIKTVLVYTAEKIGNEYKITSGRQLTARTVMRDPSWTLKKNDNF